VLLKLYKTLVRPHVEYSVSAWSPYYVKDKALLERIQHRFTRMVPGLKSLPYEERHDRLGIWTLEERKNRADLLEVFKLYKGWSSTQFGHFFTISILLRTLEAILQRLINRDVILIYDDPFSPTVLQTDGMNYHKTS